jgi:MFS family permease
VVLRFFLGVFEGGIAPGVTYLIGSWYRRYEIHTRIAGMYSVAVVASAFAGSTPSRNISNIVLAYAISKMEGVGGIRGWRWVVPSRFI